MLSVVTVHSTWAPVTLTIHSKVCRHNSFYAGAKRQCIIGLTPTIAYIDLWPEWAYTSHDHNQLHEWIHLHLSHQHWAVRENWPWIRIRDHVCLLSPALSGSDRIEEVNMRSADYLADRKPFVSVRLSVCRQRRWRERKKRNTIPLVLFAAAVGFLYMQQKLRAWNKVIFSRLK